MELLYGTMETSIGAHYGDTLSVALISIEIAIGAKCDMNIQWCRWQSPLALIAAILMVPFVPLEGDT